MNPLDAITTRAVAINHSSRTREGRSAFTAVATGGRSPRLRQAFSMKDPLLDAAGCFFESGRPEE